MPTKIPMNFGIFRVFCRFPTVKIVEFYQIDMIQELNCLKSKNWGSTKAIKVAGEELGKVDSDSKFPRFAMLPGPKTES